MKKISPFISLLLCFSAFAQDTTKKVEDIKPSTSNYNLLLIAAVGLIVLIALYFVFRQTRKRK